MLCSDGYGERKTFRVKLKTHLAVVRRLPVFVESLEAS